MDAQNLSWGILAFAGGLILSIVGIITLALMGINDPTAYGTLAAVANGCLVGLGTAMNPNRKFDDSQAELRETVQEIKAIQQQQRPPVLR